MNPEDLDLEMIHQATKSKIKPDPYLKHVIADFQHRNRQEKILNQRNKHGVLVDEKAFTATGKNFSRRGKMLSQSDSNNSLLMQSLNTDKPSNISMLTQKYKSFKELLDSTRKTERETQEIVKKQKVSETKCEVVKQKPTESVKSIIKQVIQKEQKPAKRFTLTDLVGDSRPKVSNFDIEKQARMLKKNKIDQLERFILNFDFKCDYEQQMSPLPEVYDGPLQYIELMSKAFFLELQGELTQAFSESVIKESPVCQFKYQQKDDHYIWLENTQNLNKNTFYDYFQNENLVALIPYNTRLNKNLQLKFLNSKIINGVCEQEEQGHKLLLKISVKWKQDLQFIQQNNFFVVFIDNLTTLIREYKMIRSIEFTELASVIYQPRTEPIDIPLNIPNTFFQNISQIYNRRQFQAIFKACQKYTGITLLQGPPGTGKTHTLLGVIAAFLQSPGLSSMKTRVLVCAPSNNAVDEIAYRALTFGIQGLNGKIRKDLQMLRIGSWKYESLDLKERRQKQQDPNQIVQDILLQNIIQKKLQLQGIEDPQESLRYIRRQLKELEDAKNKAQCINDLQQLAQISQKEQIFKSQLNQLKQQNFRFKDHYRQLHLETLQKADVVFTTLSSSGSKDLQILPDNFDFIIIDEACQSVELSSLIPFQYGARVVVMIGDPKQLPPTTFYPQSGRIKYNRSLFERLMKSGCEVFMLTQQYRMISQIREIPSIMFYRNSLQDDPTLMIRRAPLWFPQNLNYVLFNLLTSKEQKRVNDTSTFNLIECQFICEIFKSLAQHHGKMLDIGIITPYKMQVLQLKKLFNQVFGQGYRQDVEINTIDGFQGREKDLIIFSAVRSEDEIGFLRDMRRLNVAITRSRFGLWIIGKAETLQRNPKWNEYLNLLESRNYIINCNNFSEVSHLFN